jgi:hypothetical protein
LYLFEFRKLKIELIGMVLSVFQGILESLNSVIALYLFFQLTDSALVPVRVGPQNIQIGSQEL